MRWFFFVIYSIERNDRPPLSVIQRVVPIQLQWHQREPYERREANIWSHPRIPSPLREAHGWRRRRLLHCCHRRVRWRPVLLTLDAGISLLTRTAVDCCHYPGRTRQLLPARARAPGPTRPYYPSLLPWPHAASRPRGGGVMSKRAVTDGVREWTMPCHAPSHFIHPWHLSSRQG